MEKVLLNIINYLTKIYVRMYMTVYKGEKENIICYLVKYKNNQVYRCGIFTSKGSDSLEDSMKKFKILFTNVIGLE